MRTIFSLIFFSFFLLKITLTVAQERTTHEKTIREFYAAYNAKDYDKMSNTFSGVMKLIFNDRNIQEIFGLQYRTMGKVSVKSISSPSAGRYNVELIYDIDTTEVEKIGLALSKKNKIIGLGSRPERFEFSKIQVPDSTQYMRIQYRLDSLIRYKHQFGGFNGCVSILMENRALYSGCEGEADFAKHTPLNSNTLFELASCSKPFTAMGILILKDKQQLKLEDNISKYLPEFPYQNITIHHLLTHTSGLPDYMELFEKYWDKTKIATNHDVLLLLIKHKPKFYFRPGKKYEYCNTGYVLLSMIIEKISGKSYNDFLTSEIFVPLEMTRTQVLCRRLQNQIPENYALGYVLSDSTGVRILPDSSTTYDYVKYLDGITGDGTVNSTISDLNKWLTAVKNNRLISAETFSHAITPVQLSKKERSDYGYGWEIQSEDKYEKIIYHTGSWPGYITLTLMSVENNFSIVILTNNEYANVGKLTRRIMNIMADK